MNRRGFLRFLSVAPIAVPAAIAAGVALEPAFAAGGLVRDIAPQVWTVWPEYETIWITCADMQVTDLVQYQTTEFPTHIQPSVTVENVNEHSALLNQP